MILKGDEAKPPLSDVRWSLWKPCDGECGLHQSLPRRQSATRNKGSFMAGPRGLTCTTTHTRPHLTPHPPRLPPPPSSLTPVSHQHIRAETDSRGKSWTSSHLSKSFMTLLLPAAFTAPDTKFKVISSSQCVHVCVCVCVCVCLCGEGKLGCLFRLQCVILCMCSCVCECTPWNTCVHTVSIQYVRLCKRVLLQSLFSWAEHLSQQPALRSIRL